jgi:hypothetical protein
MTVSVEVRFRFISPWNPDRLFSVRKVVSRVVVQIQFNVPITPKIIRFGGPSQWFHCRQLLTASIFLKKKSDKRQLSVIEEPAGTRNDAHD